jgi:LPXTG-site transpeptidase (sortase) family protein
MNPRALVAALAVALAMVLVGCSAAKESPATTDDTAPPTTAAVSRPAKVRIPALEVEANVIDLGLDDKGHMQVPPDAKDAGWYVHSPVPGRPGPSVIAAHVNWKGVDGPFAHLDQLKPGDTVVIEAENGAEATFEVTHLDTIPKDQFNDQLVYGDTPDPQLRLVTCGGDFDQSAHSYRSNVIASAKLTA